MVPQAAKILIVDDGALVVRMLQRQLEQEGLSVDAVPTAEDGLARVNTEKYAAIILDDMLPGMMGTRAISEFKRLTPSPIIFVTGYPSDELQADVLALGAQSFLPKPIDIKSLLASLSKIIEQ